MCNGSIDANYEKEKPCSSSVLGLFLLPSKFKDELVANSSRLEFCGFFISNYSQIRRYQNFHLNGVTNCIPISTRAKINDTIRLFIAGEENNQDSEHPPPKKKKNFNPPIACKSPDQQI